MVMIPAKRVEGGVAVGAQRVAFDAGGDGQLGAAGTAQDGLGVPIGWGQGWRGWLARASWQSLQA